MAAAKRARWEGLTRETSLGEVVPLVLKEPGLLFGLGKGVAPTITGGTIGPSAIGTSVVILRGFPCINPLAGTCYPFCLALRRNKDGWRRLWLP